MICNLSKLQKNSHKYPPRFIIYRRCNPHKIARKLAWKCSIKEEAKKGNKNSLRIAINQQKFIPWPLTHSMIPQKRILPPAIIILIIVTSFSCYRMGHLLCLPRGHRRQSSTILDGVYSFWACKNKQFTARKWHSETILRHINTLASNCYTLDIYFHGFGWWWQWKVWASETKVPS